LTCSRDLTQWIGLNLACCISIPRCLHYKLLCIMLFTHRLSVDDFLLCTETPGDLFELVQLVKVGGELDANSNIVNYFHGIIAGLSVLFS